jgi:hypothetical protein
MADAIGADDPGLILSMALCGILAAKGIVTFDEVAETLDAMAEMPENQQAAALMLQLADKIRVPTAERECPTIPPTLH